MTRRSALKTAFALSLIGSLIAYSASLSWSHTSDEPVHVAATWTLAGDTVILPDHEKPIANMHGIVVTNRCFSAADGVPFPDAAQLRGLDLIKVLGDTTLIYELK